MKNKKGFTIIEVLITTTLILILFAIGLKLVLGAIQRAHDHSAAATMSNINSMYRMSAAFFFIDGKQQYDGSSTVSLPTDAFATYEEKTIETQMLVAFKELKAIKYSLVDNNGITNEGGVIITYYPYEDNTEEFYQWADGAITRTFKKQVLQIE